MRIVITCLFALFAIALSAQIIVFWREKGRVNGELKALIEEVARSRKAETVLENEVNYYSNPVNFEKELKSRFNYRYEGEQFLILVPDHSTSSVP